MSKPTDPSEAWERCVEAVREAADIASTFDGRLSHEPIAGGVRLLFSHPGRPVRAVAIAVHETKDGVRITARVEEDEAEALSVYEGPPKPASAMQAAMQAIGRWYGGEVRRVTHG
ncbi:hypothetical protein [Alicyclobacillus acidocaldarius]|uniref:Uncharacterized protein n=1 Tax=Alicyclobacillus acidocaldarius subsp. acidocaldarius (strain ATCC 27009 / DSM 446 / BCRC 14685 / JCM 5260 / KCTC 1825 / NBRC 15652 / NCIMB 11725 / NRRL B-14509 / 104-IA) TaxID=521098 RepID=C8WT74_ALIAD|nr:hypothetical protein [Alicyclobacillus acidocaldarius]ACV59588.1 hypothetical protein Aaci_2584 [Alicyclobacillus acidocaldarius subsp. acidocaldarius DSM 446]